MDRSGNRFMVDVCTVDISRTGARLVGVLNVKGPGDTIEVRHGSVKARFQVVWVGPAGTPRAGQIGVRSLEPVKSIWGAELPVAGPDDYQLEGPGEPSRETGAPPLAVTQSSTGGERRRHPRYACRGQVRMLLEESTVWLTGALSDISMGGCYVDVLSPLPLHSRIQMELKVGELVVRAKGQVEVSSQGMGMGIAFTEITTDSRQFLQQMVAWAADAKDGAKGPQPSSQPTETPKENRVAAPTRATTSDTLPTSSGAEVAVEYLFKLLERKAVLTRQEYLELMKILKCLDR